MSWIVRAEKLGKCYRIARTDERLPYRTLRDEIVRAASAPMRWLRSQNVSREDFWAVKDVSFDVKQGEVLGIVGRNGAGKSTLLKILSRIIRPTSGSARVRGRIGSLLEVGTGFHPELTGRENIFLSGAVLGMTKREIAKKFDEIVDFAEIEKFLDTPAKRYSSGMYVRLAFAVAAHLDADTLLVDEVLAVGDAQFQKKCLGKMDAAAHEGRTLLFVSHNITAVESLCDSVVWLEDGRTKQQGPASEVIAQYLKTSYDGLLERHWNRMEDAPGNSKIRLRSAQVNVLTHSPSKLITVRTSIELRFEFWNLVEGAILNLSLLVSNELGTPLFATGPIRELRWNGRPFPRGLFRSGCVIPGGLLNDGQHRVELMVIENGSVCIYKHDDILAFDVSDDASIRQHWFGKWIGAVRPELDWQTERLEIASENSETIEEKSLNGRVK
jgi:lipopolysaccharide transport system ATP-binding protein